MMGVGAKRALGLYRSCAPRQLFDDDSAHRFLFMGTFYFLLLGFSEMAAVKIIQNSPQAIAKD